VGNVVYIPRYHREGMVPRSRLRDWQRNALRFFDAQPKKVFQYRDLTAIVRQRAAELELPASISVSRFVEFITSHGQLREIRILPAAPDLSVKTTSTTTMYPAFTRYVWGSASPYSVALTLRPSCYLSHASAMFLHGLTQQVPKTIYVNAEQHPKPQNSRVELSQASIDRAFKRAPRKSNYVLEWEGSRFVMLSGKHTGRLEVSQLEGPSGEPVDATKLERTLIDASVRPFYAGGVYEVVEAFRTARDRIAVNTLVATLRKLDYVYPYHQAIGFYMERAGYEEKQLEKLRSLGIELDFYLTYGIEKAGYDSKWRLYVPEGLL
jgi:predicted transcriptional regulator of viral defense system